MIRHRRVPRSWTPHSIKGFKAMEGTEALERTVPVASAENRFKPRLLAWWCLLPVGVWMALEITFGWPRSIRQVSTPTDAVSFFVGRLLGGTLIALALAWIAYRVGRRSTRAASIGFTLTMALLSMAVLGARDNLTNFGEFEFKVPPGWVCVPPDRDKCKAKLLSSDAAWNSSPCLLMVDVGKPRFATTRELVQTFVDSGGSPPEAIHVDGVEGFVVETNSADLSRPRWIAAVFRDEQAYLVMAAGKNTQEIASAFGQVVKTWKWR